MNSDLLVGVTLSLGELFFLDGGGRINKLRAGSIDSDFPRKKGETLTAGWMVLE